MVRFRSSIAGVAVAGMTLAQAMAADMPDLPPPPAAPPAPETSWMPSFGGPLAWYLRGDIGYRFNGVGDVNLSAAADPTSNTLKDGGDLTVGFGFKKGWFRADFTYDYATQASYSGTILTAGDVTAKLRTDSFMGNIYADLGSWGGFTPYIGAGAGGASVRMSNYTNQLTPAATIPNKSQWVFTYAGMAGVAFQVSHNWQLDLGYRYQAFGRAEFFEATAGSAEFKNIHAHEVRLGLRWFFDDFRDQY